MRSTHEASVWRFLASKFGTRRTAAAELTKRRLSPRRWQLNTCSCSSTGHAIMRSTQTHTLRRFQTRILGAWRRIASKLAQGTSTSPARYPALDLHGMLAPTPAANSASKRTLSHGSLTTCERPLCHAHSNGKTQEGARPDGPCLVSNVDDVSRVTDHVSGPCLLSNVDDVASGPCLVSNVDDVARVTDHVSAGQ